MESVDVIRIFSAIVEQTSSDDDVPEGLRSTETLLVNRWFQRYERSADLPRELKHQKNKI